MTRRGVISIHDYPEHLNPFREEDEDLHWKYNRKERAGLNVSSRLGSPSQSPAKPERPPLPHRTRLKDKENEVASPDEDKYFRQGAKPKKKRPAPMPPSPNQQKMTPAVSDASLDSSISSLSPNAPEVPESAEGSAKGQTPSPQKQPNQEPDKTVDTASENGKPTAEDVPRGPDEIIPPSEEAKQPSDDKKPPPDETKSKTDETKLETDDAKPRQEETIPRQEEEKPHSEETESPSEETKLNGEKSQDRADEQKPAADEGSPPTDEKESGREEIEPPSDTEVSPKNANTEDASRIPDEVVPVNDSLKEEQTIKAPPTDEKRQEENEKISSENDLVTKSTEGDKELSAPAGQTESQCKE